MWRWTGQDRPPFAETPAPGQESVWDYPRPPVLERTDLEVEVWGGEALVARSRCALRVLETASPPTVYLPPDDITPGALEPVPGRSACEWKGLASYWTLATRPGEPVAWSYAAPKRAFEDLRGWVSFFPGRIRCLLGGEVVRPQPGAFYGGWVTDAIAGPFKGEPGTGDW